MKYIVAVDYDGTLFTDSYPNLGNPVIPVFEKVKEFKSEGAEIILWTCREAGTLQEAIDRCNENGLTFDAVNDNAPSHSEYVVKMLKENGHIFANRKIYANIYVDDKSPGSIEYFLKLNAVDVIQNKRKRD
jgi:hypothetical protein